MTSWTNSEAFRSLGGDAAHIAVLDSSGVIVEVNEAWKRFARSQGYGDSGYGIGVNYISTCRRATGPQSDGAKTIAAGLETVLSGQQPLFVAEYPCHAPEEQRWFQLIATPHAMAAQGGILVAHLPITPRKIAERRLRQTERRLRAIIDNSPTTISLKDTSGRYRLVNKRFCELFDVTEAQVIGSRPKDLLPGAIAESSEAHDRTTLETGHADLHEESVEIDGDLRTLFTVKFPVTDDAGQVEYIGSISTDVTERRSAQAALHQLSARLIKAHEDERQRIARDLHDDVSQRLALLAIDVAQLRDQIPDSDPAIRSLIDSLLAGINALGTDLHRLSHQLHPAILENVGLVAAIRSHCEEVSTRHGIKVEFAHNEEPGALPKGVSLCLYRVTQEALRNVAQHSGARTAQVALEADERTISLNISDDGVGFDPKDPRLRQGLGLLSMQERLRLVGGDILITRLKPSGTRVEVSVPTKSDDGDSRAIQEAVGDGGKALQEQGS